MKRSEARLLAKLPDDWDGLEFAWCITDTHLIACHPDRAPLEICKATGVVSEITCQALPSHTQPTELEPT